MTDKDCIRTIGNSYECITCGRFFSSAQSRNLCTHDACKGCRQFRDDVYWVEGEGFYCDGCGGRMAGYY
ncbi:hypothetical protein [Intestinibacter bartlettii]|uniref:Uncharacterized protein n=1 Tax=Intestinibacter bartlettii TaxID=261299 RepID=A0ABS6DXR6_9FIRM|nr:hypothetical protein [Intestinibacter bartlettii]MBU5336574.1 hypothetical protein [Intestinibacter bartlettii]